MKSAAVLAVVAFSVANAAILIEEPESINIGPLASPNSFADIIEKIDEQFEAASDEMVQVNSNELPKDFELDFDVEEKEEEEPAASAAGDDGDDEWWSDDYWYWYDDDEASEVIEIGPSEEFPFEGGIPMEDGEVVIELPFPSPPSFFGNIFGPPPSSTSTSSQNTPSHTASDASVNSAVNSMFQTPHAQEYQQEAYEAMTKVRANCKYDYQATCSASSDLQTIFGGMLSLLSSQVMSPIFSTSSQPAFKMAPRARRLLLEEDIHGSFLKKLKGHMVNMKHDLHGAIGDIHQQLKPQLDEMANKFAAFRGDFDVPSHRHSKFSFHEEDVVKDETAPPLSDITSPRDPHVLPIDPLPAQGNLFKRGEMNTPMFISPSRAHTLRGHSTKRHLDEREGRPCHHDHDHHQGREHHEEDGDEFDRHPWEHMDTAYTGELLWGPQGDRCMYENFDDLSEQCQNSILDVYAFRSEYMEEEDAERNGPLAFLFFFSLVLLVIVLAKRRARIAKFEKDEAMYQAMAANPELKAQMESASGIVMDAPVYPGAKCAAGGCAFTFLRVVICFLSGVLSLHFAIFITIICVEGMVREDENGNVYLPHPIFALFIFFFVLISTMIVMIKIAARCQSKQKRKCRRSVGAAASLAVASAGTTHTPPPSPQLQAQQARPQPQVWNLSNWMPSAFSARSTNSVDYQVLPGESSHGGQREMVVITSAQPTAPQPTVVLSSFPSTATSITPVNII